MIRAGAGFSRSADPVAAATEAVAAARGHLGGADADWCLAFSTGELLASPESVLATLAAAAGTPYVVGCSAAGVLAAGEEVEHGPALGVLLVAGDRMRATPFLFSADEDRGLTTGQRVGERLLGSRRSRDLVLVWPDPFHVRPDRLLGGIAQSLGDVPVAGAAASNGTPGSDTFQFCGDECRPAAVSGIRLGGEFEYRVAITQGCRPLGAPHRITGAHENLILEIDGRPALDVLRDAAPPGALDSLERAFNRLFVGLLPAAEAGPVRAGEYLVRSIVAADPDTGVLAIGDTVEEGQPILFAAREGAAARADLARMIDDVKADCAGMEPRFALYFDCLARGRALYGEEGVDSALLHAAFPGLPVAGFFCNAEMAPLRGVNQLFTYTGVLVVVGE